MVDDDRATIFEVLETIRLGSDKVPVVIQMGGIRACRLRKTITVGLQQRACVIRLGCENDVFEAGKNYVRRTVNVDR